MYVMLCMFMYLSAPKMAYAKSSIYVRNEGRAVPVLTFQVGKLLLEMVYSCQVEK